MAFKPFSKKKDDVGGMTIEDLITLEHYDEARKRLTKYIEKRPTDLHAHLRLGDVYLRLKKLPEARDQYLHVCRAYGREGFYDRAVAVLVKVGRYFPDDDKISTLLAELERAQRLEVVRTAARDHYLQTRDSAGAGSEAIEFVRVWESLSRSGFADRFSTAEVVWWFAATRTLVMRRGQTLVAAGDTDPRVFVIALGGLEARAPGTDSVLRTFQVGDVIGEWALFEDKAWPADYVVTTGATLLVLDAEGIQTPFEGGPLPASFKDRIAGQHLDLEVARSVAHVGA